MVNEIKNAIELKNITKIINKRTILKDICLDIKYGEIFGLLGPNGAGKTTLMRVITGLIKPTSGDVYIDGMNLVKYHEESLAQISAIIESPEMYKHLSGYLNLKLMSNMYSNVKKEKIDEVAKIAGISDALKSKVKTYSLGMRQRLGFAATLLNDPKILILDEPLNGLDPDGVREMRNILIHLAHEEGVCVIISSHILSEMELICDRFTIISNGKIIETKDINSKDNNDVSEVKIHLLEQVSPIKIEEILNSLKIKIISLSNDEFTITQNPKVIAEVINTLVKENIKIVSVVPHKKSLEEYFMQKIGDSKK